MLGKLLKRHEKVAFYGVTDEQGITTFYRMRGFTKMDISKNPQEYKRKYVDECFEQTDVVGFSPSISFSFDRYSEDPVHDDIIELSDNEVLGTDAVRTIVIADFSTMDEECCVDAVRRDFSVMVETEGNSPDAYTLSGVMNAKGEKVIGRAAISDDRSCLVFMDNE